MIQDDTFLFCGKGGRESHHSGVVGMVAGDYNYGKPPEKCPWFEEDVSHIWANYYHS